MNNEKLKKKFLEYYSELPSQRLAASAIGRNEDTILRWRTEDTDFAEQVEKAKAAWALDKFRGVRDPQWVLARVLRDDFSDLPVKEVLDEIQLMRETINEIKREMKAEDKYEN